MERWVNFQLPGRVIITLPLTLYGTAHHVETTVRKYRQACELQVLDKARAHCESRGLTYRHEEDDSLVIRVKLPPEQGEVVLNALRAMADRLWKDGHVSAETSSSDTGGVSAETSDQHRSRYRRRRMVWRIDRLRPHGVVDGDA